MESERRDDDRIDSDEARATLDSLQHDRADLADLMRSQTGWAAPAQGGAVALLVAAPAAGMPWMGLLSGLAVLALVGVEHRFRTRTGVSITRPAGPLGLLALVIVLLLMVLGVGASLVLSLSGSTGSALLVALAAGVLMTAGVGAYDRVYAHEVRRVR